MAIFFLPTCSRSCVHDCGPARSLSWITYPRIRSRECVSRLRLREPGSSICRLIRPTSTLLNKPGRRSNKSCAHSRHAPPKRLKPQSLRLSPLLLLRTQSLGFPIVAMVYNIVENALEPLNIVRAYVQQAQFFEKHRYIRGRCIRVLESFCS